MGHSTSCLAARQECIHFFWKPDGFITVTHGLSVDTVRDRSAKSLPSELIISKTLKIRIL